MRIFTGQSEITCFPDLYDKAQQYLKADDVIMVTGEPELRGGKVKIIARDIVPIWKVRDNIRSIVLRIDSDRVQQETIGALRKLCEANPGKCHLYFALQADDLPLRTLRVRSRSCKVAAIPDLMQGIARLIGNENIAVEA